MTVQKPENRVFPGKINNLHKASPHPVAALTLGPARTAWAGSSDRPIVSRRSAPGSRGRIASAPRTGPSDAPERYAQGRLQSLGGPSRRSAPSDPLRPRRPPQPPTRWPAPPADRAARTAQEGRYCCAAPGGYALRSRLPNIRLTVRSFSAGRSAFPLRPPDHPRTGGLVAGSGPGRRRLGCPGFGRRSAVFGADRARVVGRLRRCPARKSMRRPG
jgi:hypothetical protein